MTILQILERLSDLSDDELIELCVDQFAQSMIQTQCAGRQTAH
jgi:hypothetical protein